MKRLFLLPVSCFLLAFLLTACLPPLPEDGSLIFQTLEQKNDSAYSLQEQYTPLEPGLVVIDSEDSRAQYENWFGEKGRKALGKLNFTTRLAIGVFQGWQTTGGYGVEIERITRTADVVTVVARFTEPGLGGATGAITSPYQLVRVDKAGDWHTRITYQLVINGEIIAVFPTPEP
ncbi:MAG: protease complex subunit PrcB family protein [Anaerolineales bacterium]|nr:protease complex subunit PrcB family protein [Anaerolineales bacterium]